MDAVAESLEISPSRVRVLVRGKVIKPNEPLDQVQLKTNSKPNETPAALCYVVQILKKSADDVSTDDRLENNKITVARVRQSLERFVEPRVGFIYFYTPFTISWFHAIHASHWPTTHSLRTMHTHKFFFLFCYFVLFAKITESTTPRCSRLLSKKSHSGTFIQHVSSPPFSSSVFFVILKTKLTPTFSNIICVLVEPSQAGCGQGEKMATISQQYIRYVKVRIQHLVL